MRVKVRVAVRGVVVILIVVRIRVGSEQCDAWRRHHRGWLRLVALRGERGVEAV